LFADNKIKYFIMDRDMERILVFFALITIAYSSSVNAEQKLVFSGIKDSVNSDISFLVLKEAYNKLGFSVEYRPLPGERALRTANAGEVDGEIFRIRNIEKKYKNLIPIPTPINVLEGVVFSKNPNLKIKSWEQLADMNIGIQVGIKFAERATKNMSRITVDSNEQLFKMLDSNRVDVAIVALTNGLKSIIDLKLAGIHATSPPIEQFPLYHYLHKKNKALVARVNKIIQDMEKSGRIKQIRNIILKNLVAASH